MTAGATCSECGGELTTRRVTVDCETVLPVECERDDCNGHHIAVVCSECDTRVGWAL